MKRVVIVHGWGGHPDEAWFPWLAKKLEARGYSSTVPLMPNPDSPVIEGWVNKLSDVIGLPDEKLSLVGHSIGCQTIWRYLERLEGVKIDKVLCVAGWFYELTGLTKDELEITKPWTKNKIDFKKVTAKAKNFSAILSDNDKYVPLEYTKEKFKEYLSIDPTIVHNKGHIGSEDNVPEFDLILKQFE